jgi:hypothetical protein
MAVSFAATIMEIPAHVQREMRGVSWQPVPDCPAFADLRLIALTHHSFVSSSSGPLGAEAPMKTGELVVHHSVAREVVSIFARLFELGFAIERLERVDHYAGDDALSMAANNSSAFNFRRIEGTELLSQHALGLAIDLNPVQNPWVRGQRVDPELGRAYLNREDLRPGMIV